MPAPSHVLLIVLALAVVWTLVSTIGPVARWRLRRRMIGMLDPRLPPAERAAAVRRIREQVPVARSPQGFAPLPPGADPTVPTVPVRVAPLGDGRPGEAFLAPGPGDPRAGVLGDDGNRTDAVVGLGSGRALLVVCLGRVGRVVRGELLPAAPDRPVQARAVGDRLSRAVGEVEHAVTAAGPAWRTSAVVGTRRVTDTHLDRDGWAFVVGVLRADGDDGLDPLVDAVLATWQWLPDDPDAPPHPPAPALPDDPCAAAVPVVVQDPGGQGVATCRLPAPPTAAGVPSADGTWTHLYVRLTRGASLVVTSAPQEPGRDARTALGTPAVHDYGPVVQPTGPVAARTTPAGPVLVRTFTVGENLLRTEVRTDRDGRTWAWTLTRTTRDDGVAPALDGLLGSWRWL